jgi:hypothetical protein
MADSTTGSLEHTPLFQEFQIMSVPVSNALTSLFSLIVGVGVGRKAHISKANAPANTVVRKT